jgi:hypothetical protein
MAQETAKLRKTSNAYNIFTLVLTVLSLAVRDRVKVMISCRVAAVYRVC